MEAALSASLGTFGLKRFEMLKGNVESTSLIVLYGKSRTWDETDASSLSLLVISNIRKPAVVSPAVQTAFVSPPLPEHPLCAVNGERILQYEGCTFRSKVSDCNIVNDGRHVHLRDPESPATHQSLESCRTLLLYLQYRLQTMNTNLNHQQGWPVITLPLNESDHVFNDEPTVCVLYKPPQSMKTFMSMAYAWTYAFIRGWVACFMIRSVGGRHTGLVSLRTKGVTTVNKHIRDFLRDVEPQFKQNGWNASELCALLQLKIKTDADIKWGDAEVKSLRGTRHDDPRRELRIVEQAQIISNTPGVCIAILANPTGVNFWADVLVKVNRINKTVVFHDEADEGVSSSNRTLTKFEKAMYPEGCVQRAGEEIESGSEDEEDDEDEYFSCDDEEPLEFDDAESLVREFEKTRLSAVPHVILITATFLSLLFVNRRSKFYITPMKVPPNYIGIGTPDYCISKILHRDVPFNQPSASVRLTVAEWWAIEGATLTRIFESWTADRSAALLMTTSGTTNMISKQETGANAIVKNATFPVVCIVNNGRRSLVHVASRFLGSASNSETAAKLDQVLQENLAHRAKLQETHWGTRGDIIVTQEGDVHTFDLRSFCICQTLQEVKVHHKIVTDVAVYHRQHPSLLFEVACALFQIMLTRHPFRIVFLETDTIAGREKTYCTFDFDFTLTDLLFVHKTKRNIATTLQTFGRPASVFTQLDPALRKRCIWTPSAVWQEAHLGLRQLDLCVGVSKKFPGHTLEQIEERVAGKSTILLTDEEKEAWSRVCSKAASASSWQLVEQQLPGMQEGNLNQTNTSKDVVTLTQLSHYEQLRDSMRSVPLHVTKRVHQTEVNRHIKKMPAPPTVPPDIFATQRINNRTLSLEKLSGGEIVSSRLDAILVDSFELDASEEAKEISPGSEALEWFCNALLASRNTSTVTEIWFLLLCPWFPSLAPNLNTRRILNGLLASLVHHFVDDEGLLKENDFSEIFSCVTFGDTTLSRPMVEYIRSETSGPKKRAAAFSLPPIVERISTGHGKFVKLASEWDTFFKYDATSSIRLDMKVNHALLREFAGPEGLISTWTKNLVGRLDELGLLQHLDGRLHARQCDAQMLPNEDYRVKFQADLSDASKRMDLQFWNTMHLRIKTDKRRYWCLLCWLFIKDGRVLDQRKIAQADLDKFKQEYEPYDSRSGALSMTNFRHHLCESRNSARGYRKAASGGGVHLIEEPSGTFRWAF